MRALLCSILFCFLAQSVCAQCNATITPLGPTTFCAPGSVTLQASPGNVYRWFHNGNYFALLVTNTLTVNTSGSYVVVVDSAGCSDTSAALVVIANTVTPQPVISTSSNSFCDGDSAILTASSGSAYQWYFNGTAISGANNNIFYASAAGSYEVAVDSMECIGTSSAQTLTMNTVPPQPGPISGPTQICEGSVYTYSVAPVSGATSYAWGGSNASWSVFYAVTNVPTHTDNVGRAEYPYTSPGATVFVKAVNGCGESLQSSLNVNSYTPRNLNGMINDPDITYSAPFAYICPTGSNELNAFSHPGTVGYSPQPAFQWYRNNAAIAGETSYSLYIQKGGSYKVVLNMGNGACIQTIQKVPIHQVTPMPASVDILTPQPMCGGGVAALKVNFDMDGYDGTAYNWWWTRNDTGIAGTQYLITSVPGVYKIGMWGYGYNNNIMQCPLTSVLADISISNNQATPIAITQSGMVLSAIPGFASYQWYRNNSPIPGATNSTYMMTTWGDYFVLATDGNGCVSKSNIVLDVQKTTTLDSDLKLYPNPNIGTFNLSATMPVENRTATVSVMDISGKVLLTKAIDVTNGTIEEQLSLGGNLAPGIYMLKVSSTAFNKVTSFVKQ